MASLTAGSREMRAPAARMSLETTYQRRSGMSAHSLGLSSTRVEESALRATGAATEFTASATAVPP